MVLRLAPGVLQRECSVMAEVNPRYFMQLSRNSGKGFLDDFPGSVGGSGVANDPAINESLYRSEASLNYACLVPDDHHEADGAVFGHDVRLTRTAACEIPAGLEQVARDKELFP